MGRHLGGEARIDTERQGFKLLGHEELFHNSNHSTTVDLTSGQKCSAQLNLTRKAAYHGGKAPDVSAGDRPSRPSLSLYWPPNQRERPSRGAAVQSLSSLDPAWCLSRRAHTWQEGQRPLEIRCVPLPSPTPPPDSSTSCCLERCGAASGKYSSSCAPGAHSVRRSWPLETRWTPGRCCGGLASGECGGGALRGSRGWSGAADAGNRLIRSLALQIAGAGEYTSNGSRPIFIHCRWEEILGTEACSLSWNVKSDLLLG